MIRIELSGPPQGKGRGRAVSTAKGARVYSDPKTVKYETQLRHAATMVMGDKPPLEGPVELWMDVRFPIPKSWSQKKRNSAAFGVIFPTVKPDNDNLLKIIDALNEIIFRDDKQVVRSHVSKTYSDRPGMTIEVMPL